MALSRSFRRTLGIASIAALLTAGLIAPPAQADDHEAIPSIITVNCSNWSATATEVIGDEGDTFVMINNGASSCTVTHNGAISGSGTIPSGGGKGSFTIATASFFTITDGLGVSHNITVKLPGSVPGPVIALIDADGGVCKVASFTADFVFPGAEGDECSKDGYELVNWTIPSDQSEATYAPGDSFSFASPKRTANFTIFANWKLAQFYNEITYDANVGGADDCIVDEGRFQEFNSPILLPLNLRRTQPALTPVGTTLRNPMCYPAIDNGDLFRFLGWNTEANGTGTLYYPDLPDIPSRFTLDGGGQEVTLYAQWTTSCPTVDSLGLVSPKPLGRAAWMGCDLSGADLSGEDLRAVDMSGANLTDADFFQVGLDGIDRIAIVNAETNLNDAFLVGATLSKLQGSGISAKRTIFIGADLKGANLSECKCTEAVLINADLTGADLKGADLKGATLFRARLHNAELSGAVLDLVSSGRILGTPENLPEDWIIPEYDTTKVTDLLVTDDQDDALGQGDIAKSNRYLVGPSANLGSADLSNRSLTDATLTNVNLRRAKLTDADLTDANLTDANLAGADLTGADLIGAVLTNADLTNAVLTGADLTDAVLTDADLIAAVLIGADLLGANLTGADLAGANLDAVSSGGITGNTEKLPTNWILRGGYLIGPDADLIGLGLTRLGLTDAVLTNANLTGAVLTGVDLPNAMQGVDLTNAVLGFATNLASANLTGATLTAATLTDVSLQGATLTGATLTGADLTLAIMFGVTSGGITGNTEKLPTNWILRGGYLIGFGADLTNANLTGLDLTGADLGRVTWSNTTCPNGTVTNTGC
jgi:uncharacterized protein YjbI with pentapeptide repeats